MQILSIFLYYTLYLLILPTVILCLVEKMSLMDWKEEILHLEEYGEQGWSTATVRITKWVYYVPRVKLTIVQGIHNSSEAIDKAIGSYGKDAECPHYPKHITIICRPNEMLQLVKTITEFCK